MTIADPLYHFRNWGTAARYKKRGEDAKKGVPSACVVLKCVECSGGEYAEAKNCTITTCPLYPLNERFLKRRSAQKHAAERRRQSENP